MATDDDQAGDDDDDDRGIGIGLLSCTLKRKSSSR